MLESVLNLLSLSARPSLLCYFECDRALWLLLMRVPEQIHHQHEHANHSCENAYYGNI